MKSKINKWITIGIILLFLCLPMVTTLGVVQTPDWGEKTLMEMPELNKRDYQPSKGNYSLKNSFSRKISSYTSYRPIFIKGNDDFIAKNGVVAGDGTEENPYIIEGWEIKGNKFWKMINRILWHLEHLVLGGIGIWQAL